MRQHRIDVTAHSFAVPSAVWALLRDGASWPTWSPIDSYELEQAGREEKDGLGSIRWFRTKRATSTAKLREEIVEFTPERRMQYVVLEGLPVQDYTGTIDLTPDQDGTGTSIRWRASFSANPLLGWLVRRSLTGVLTACAQGLAEHAARQSSAPSNG